LSRLYLATRKGL